MLAALDATGQAANTLVIRTADHGDYVGAHGLFLKGVPAFREAYNVPLIVRWPARSGDAGRSIDDFVTLADLAPTVLEAARRSHRRGSPVGASCRCSTGSAPPTGPMPCYAQMNGVELYYTQRAVTTATHKYVYNGFDFDELYDLVADPDETVNLSDDAAYTEVKRGLVERMWRFADDEDDELVFCQYPPVALAPWGPSPRPEAMAERAGAREPGDWRAVTVEWAEHASSTPVAGGCGHEVRTMVGRCGDQRRPRHVGRHQRR